MCLIHEVPLADGDHSDCPVELLTCPEHREEQLQKMGIPVSNDLPCDGGATERSMFTDKDGKPIIGFCLWCNKDFYCMNELETHNSTDLAVCKIFRDFKNTDFL
jgi:hypothetical protein